MRRLFACLLAISLVTGSRAQFSAPVVKPVPHPIPGIERVLIIGIDGLRPDRLLIAHTPVIRDLMKQGAYTMWMQTVASANTLPSPSANAVVPDGFAGAITAALFLEKFVDKVPWAHLDIYAWKDSPEGAWLESGGSGQGVLGLSQWLGNINQ